MSTGWLVRLGIAGVVIGAIAAAPTVVRAEDGKGEYAASWSGSAVVGLAIPVTNEYGNAIAWRLAGEYAPRPWLGVDLEVGGFSTSVSQPDANGIPTYTIASGEIAVRSVSVTARWLPPQPESYVTFHLLGGVGYYVNDYTMAAASRAVFTTGGVAGLPDQKVRDGWGLHLGADAEYVLSEHLSLVGEGRFIFLHPDISGTASPGNRIDGSINLNTWVFTGGVRISF